MIRITGNLFAIPGTTPLSPEEADRLVLSLANEGQREYLTANKEFDFSFELKGKSRFRINAYTQKGSLAAALRLLPVTPPDLSKLNLPEICLSFPKLKQGFILITGPTGHGKSTTLAGILERINETYPSHIVTVEDPIEFMLVPKKSIISQREVKNDTLSWNVALRSCLREDPDIVMVGEMRDYETISSAITIAETGHLVFSTLHTNSAAQTVDRVVDVFPQDQQDQIRMQFSMALEAIISQRLVPAISGGRVPATEILVCTPAVRTAIREGKTHLINNIIQTSGELGMRTLEMDLVRLIKAGKIDLETAKIYSSQPEEIGRLMRAR